jgi:hypothetical protein
MPTTPTYLSPTWCNLHWSTWVPFEARLAEFRAIPTGAGVYRVRVKGEPILAYIGQTGRNLRQRFHGLHTAIAKSNQKS